jgi:DNA polymerase-1
MQLEAQRDLAGVQVHLLDHSDKIADFKSWLSQRHDGEALAFDLETSGLSPYDKGARIRLAQVGDAMTGWAIPWDMWPGLVVETLTEWDGYLDGHNIGFDIKWMEEFSPWRANWSKIRDTMLMARLVNPLFPAGLKPQSDRFIDARASIGQKLLDEAFVKNGWTWDTVPVEFAPYWSYGALDTVLTRRLDDMYQPAVGAGMPYAEAFDLEMATLRITTRMEQKGAAIDLDYCTEMYDKCYDYESQLKQWARDSFGGVQIGSPGQLARKFHDLGAEISIFTEKGHPKVDKWQLQIFADPDNDYPVAAQKLASVTLEQRKYGKLAGSYFGNFISQNKDGIIHASINPMAARTGRMSIGNPALQQLPRGDALVRRAFLAREGNALIATDFSQIEMRMMAVFADDPELQRAFREADETGGDFFVNLGREIYRDPDFSKADSRRNLIKSSLYGKAYGAGVTKMAETAGIPVDRMRAVSESIDARYPGIKNFMRKIEDIGKRREMSEGEGYVMGIDGRRLPCDTGRVYTLVNYCVAPETPILRSDLTHASASKIQVGDRLVAFDEHPTPNPAPTVSGRVHNVRRWRTAVVEAVSTVVKPSMRVTLEDGRSVVCSTDHQWLVVHSTKTQPRTRWAQASDLTVGSVLHSVGTPWEVDESRGAGWLAGLYDGEGYLGTRPMGKSTTSLVFSQLPGAVMDKFMMEMDQRDLGYKYIASSPSSTSPTASCVTSSLPRIMRVLGTLQPERFRSKFESVYEGGALTGGSVDHVRVSAIEHLGDCELSSIQTTTRTLIANGILSHNCIQGGAAVIYKRALSRLDAAGYGDTFIVPVHDEIIMDIPAEDAAAALVDVPRIMQDNSFAVSIPAHSGGPYPDWGGAYR